MSAPCTRPRLSSGQSDPLIIRTPNSRPIRMVMSLSSAPDRCAHSAASISSLAVSANRLTAILSDRRTFLTANSSPDTLVVARTDSPVDLHLWIHRDLRAVDVRHRRIANSRRNHARVLRVPHLTGPSEAGSDASDRGLRQHFGNYDQLSHWKN